MVDQLESLRGASWSTVSEHKRPANGAVRLVGGWVLGECGHSSRTAAAVAAAAHIDRGQKMPAQLDQADVDACHLADQLPHASVVTTGVSGRLRRRRRWVSTTRPTRTAVTALDAPGFG